MVYEQPWPYTAMHSRLCKTPRLCGVCDARLSAAGARLSSRLNDSVPGRPACGVGRCKGARWRLSELHGDKPSCAAAARVETSGTVGLCPEEDGARRARLCAVPCFEPPGVHTCAHVRW